MRNLTWSVERNNIMNLLYHCRIWLVLVLFFFCSSCELLSSQMTENIIHFWMKFLWCGICQRASCFLAPASSCTDFFYDSHCSVNKPILYLCMSTNTLIPWISLVRDFSLSLPVSYHLFIKFFILIFMREHYHCTLSFCHNFWFAIYFLNL